MQADSKKYQDFLNELRIPSSLDRLHIPDFKAELWIKRDDLIHPIVSGNKWRKLSFHLKAFLNGPFKGLVSMGGPHSNHLHALNYTAHLLGIPCVNLMYGWNYGFQTSTISDSISWDVKCIAISRIQAEKLRQMQLGHGDFGYADWYWIPEGGGGELGIMGAMEILKEIPEKMDHKETIILCACGTGTTISGLLNSSRYLKIGSMRRVRNAHYNFESDPRFFWIPDTSSVRFGKVDSGLLSFIEDFGIKTGIPLDIVYNGPLMRAYLARSSELHFNQIVYIHTGGLQGNRQEKSPAT